MGNQVNNGEVPFLLCDEIWKRLNAAMCNSNNAVNQIESEIKSIAIYPNPANSEISIDIKSTGTFEVQILNMIGEVVLTVQNNKAIDISHLASGVYTISLKQGEQVYTHKLIKL
ncbi:MAG: T9SS type A sorting domain-containing protein [Bacteroidetes bacterium]|nr:T9SS type A sorting domain-containing protein [Bacteroidota bacterium]